VLRVPMSQANAPLFRKLDETVSRLESLQASLHDPVFLSNSQRMVAASKEAGQLGPVVQRYTDYRKAEENTRQLQEMTQTKTAPEMAELAAAELPEAIAHATQLLESLKDEFLAAEDNAVDSFFLEVRAGTGGDE